LSEANSVFVDVPAALEELRAGRMLIVVDDESRENEGDFLLAAEKATPEAINFMARHGRGLICLALPERRCDELGLRPMVENNTSPFGTAFAVSIEARGRVTTGISAHDRAATIRVAADPQARPEDLLRPGHVFPLRARTGGVLERPGHTEAGVDLTRLAGLQPAAVLCEILAEDGSMARLPDLERLAREHGLRILKIADLIQYLLLREASVERVAEAWLPTRWGEWRLAAFESRSTGEAHMALWQGDLNEPEPVLVRVHSQCLTGDVFGSERCDCGAQLELALDRIQAVGRGVLVYLAQEGRGIGLLNKVRAYALQDRGLDTVEANHHLGFPADAREYGVAAQILRALGVRRLRLLSNNPHKLAALTGYGLEIVERLPLEITARKTNRAYLRAKRDKLGHLLTVGLEELS
jgi:3,4-dihydroxy 2-butanone 4-phosphate synthase/GTP cyclohydrolase II